MNKLSLSLKNCYGIKELNDSFDFSQNKNIRKSVKKDSEAQTLFNC